MSCLTSLTRRRTFGGADSTDLVRAIGKGQSVTKKTQFSLFIGARCVKLMGNIAHELLPLFFAEVSAGLLVRFRFYDDFVLSEAFFVSPDSMRSLTRPAKEVEYRNDIFENKHTFMGPLLCHYTALYHAVRHLLRAAMDVPGAVIKSACESCCTHTQKVCESKTKWKMKLYTAVLLADESDGSIEWRSFCVFSRNIWPMLAG